MVEALYNGIRKKVTTLSGTAFFVFLAYQALFNSGTLLVSVAQHSWRAVGERLRRLPGVEWMALSTGSSDYVVLVRAPDIDHLRDVVLDGLQAIPEIQSTQTLLLLDEPVVPGVTGVSP